MKLNVPKRCLCSKWSGMQGYKYLGEGGGGLIIKLITTRTSYTIKYCDVLKSKLWSAVLIIHKINVKVKLHEQNQLLYKLAIVNEALLYKKTSELFVN